MTEATQARISRVAITGVSVAILPGLLFVADLLWDVTSRVPANHTLTSLFGYALLAITLAGGVASVWGLVQVRRNRPLLKGVHLARIGIVLSLLNVWFVPHVARVIIREPVDWRRHNCVYNMRQMDNAKEQWAIDTGATNGAPVLMEDIARYLPNKQSPGCPAGGTYKIGVVEEPTSCTMHGTALESRPTAAVTVTKEASRQPDLSVAQSSQAIIQFYEAPSAPLFAAIVGAQKRVLESILASGGGPEAATHADRLFCVFVSFVWKKHGYSGSPLPEAKMERICATVEGLAVDSPGDLDILWAAFFATGDERYLERLGNATASVDQRVASSAAWSLRANASKRKAVSAYLDRNPTVRLRVTE